jgi:hypothetical protein
VNIDGILTPMTVSLAAPSITRLATSWPVYLLGAIISAGQIATSRARWQAFDFDRCGRRRVLSVIQFLAASQSLMLG